MCSNNKDAFLAVSFWVLVTTRVQSPVTITWQTFLFIKIVLGDMKTKIVLAFIIQNNIQIQIFCIFCMFSLNMLYTEKMIC